MSRPSRVFKLRLSPAGMDLLICAHCHLIRSTRSLLPWGTTLHVAVALLESTRIETVLATFRAVVEGAYLGSQEHFLGAPKGVNEIAARIAAKVTECSGGAITPLKSEVYIAALHCACSRGPQELRAVLARVRGCRNRDAGGPP